MICNAKAIYTGVFLIGFGLLATGCFNESKISSPAASLADDETRLAVETTIPDNETTITVKPKQDVSYDEPKEPTVKQAGADHASEDGADSGDGDAAADQEQTSDQPKKIDHPPFNPDKPTLMGFAINASRNAVVQRYGEPDHQSEMKGPEETIDVFQYTGFSVGFNASHRILFIDVDSDEVNPGLSGIRIGSAADEVISTLGKPFSDTEYVISYQGAGMVLKLDMDPGLHKVTSIKLFASE